MIPNVLPVRERIVVLSGLGFITALSWGYMWYLARDPMAMCMVNMNPWSILKHSTDLSERNFSLYSPACPVAGPPGLALGEAREEIAMD